MKYIKMVIQAFKDWVYKNNPDLDGKITVQDIEQLNFDRIQERYK